MLWYRVDAAFGSRRLLVATVAALLSAMAGCATGTLDQRNRHLVSAGLGGASLEDGQFEIHGEWAVSGAYEYRLTGPDGWLAIFARAGTHAVFGASVKGEGVRSPCDLLWAIAGPSLSLQIPSSFPVSFLGDFGAALAHVSRNGCSDSRRTRATAVVPQVGYGLLMATAPGWAWKLGGRSVRLPLDDVDIGSEPRWAGVAEVSLIFAF